MYSFFKLNLLQIIFILIFIIFILIRFIFPTLYFLFFDFYVIITVLIFLAIFLLYFIDNFNLRSLCFLSIIISFLIFFITLDIFFLFDFFDDNFQFSQIYNFRIFNMEYRVGLDGISIWFVILTTFLIPFVILYNYGVVVIFFKEYLMLLFLLEWCMFNVFVVTNFFWFFVFFESVLIPMFVIIGIWGSRRRKIHAGYQFLFYTLIGSVFMFISLFILYTLIGVLDFDVLQHIYIEEKYQLLLFLFIFIGFAVKVPILPVHIWLPEAHVEAPTVGSVLLAGVLLKLGGYGMVRLLLLTFSDVLPFFVPFIYTLCIISVLYGACTTIRQIDLKKVIAYSSVVHMNFGLLGLFTYNFIGIEGSIFSMLSHGLVSSALFLSIGFLYDRFHTRNIKYFGGLILYMPLFGFCFFLYTLANMGLPGTSSFVGEFLILISLFNDNTFIAFLGGLGLVLSGVYVIWLYNRVMFGMLNKKFLVFRDMSKREFFVNLPFIILIIFFGIYPRIFFDSVEFSVSNLILF